MPKLYRLSTTTNNSIKINCYVKKENLSFLIDTGADISICKQKDIENIDKRNISNLSGITLETIESIGTAYLNLHFEKQHITHNFHIVSNDFPIPTDGIIGRDLLEKCKCKIDFETYTATFNISNEEFVIPINTKCVYNTEICIPARTEAIVSVDICTDKDSIIFNKEIAPGVFLANSIIPALGNKHVKILNTTEKDVVVNSIDFEKDDLENYEIYNYTKSDSSVDNDRIKKVLEDLDIQSLDPIAKQSLTDIIVKYNDIFHIDGDKLTVNNFYTQQINTTVSTPVYTRPYRLPETQINEIDEQVDKLLQDDIIEESVSPYNSPLLVVPKKKKQRKKKRNID